jgi:hypothetical protein
MKRHHPVVGGITGQRARGRAINQGFRIGRRQHAPGDRVDWVDRASLALLSEVSPEFISQPKSWSSGS